MTTTILLAEAHTIFRKALRSLLERERMEVIGEARDGREALRLARQLNPRIIIMDICMPVLNGVDATREINRELPDIKVIALSMYSDRYYIKDMLKAGACGYVTKDCPATELIEAIHKCRFRSKGAIYSGLY